MDALVVACGPAAGRPEWAPVRSRDGVDWREVPSMPGKSDLEPLPAGPSRVVVVGTDADLAAVVLRLLRAGLLDRQVGFLPVGPSVVAALWELPADPSEAAELAITGEAVPLPLIRDDSGGVLIGRGSMGPVDGEAYCDDQLALRGRARLIEVVPDPNGGVLGRVYPTGLLRRRPAVFRGRAFQVGCHPVTVTRDGVEHPRPVLRWTWYRHTEDLRAIRPSGRVQTS